MGLNIVVGIEIFYPQINGVVTSTMNLLHNFKEMGHNPIIITPQVVKGTSPIVDGIPVHYIPSTSAFAYPGLRLINHKSNIFRHIVTQHNADIIHNTAPWFIAKALNKVAVKKNIPLVHVFHTNLHNPAYIQHIVPFTTRKIIQKYLTKIVWHSYKQFLLPNDVIVSPNPHTCSDITKHFPHKRVEWIPNGIAIDQFKTNNEEKLLPTVIPNLYNKPYAIFVGRHAKEKSIDILIRAVAEVIKQVPDFHLVLVGDGPQFNQLVQLAKQLHLFEKHITFLGKIQHEFLIKSNLIQNARFFVTASTTENHSMTVIEALCCGIPIIAPDDPSMTFFAKDTGIFFQPNNPTAMSAAIIQMCEDEKIYMQKKKAALHILSSFDGKRIAELYLSLYHELLAQKKKKHSHHS